MPDNSGSRVNKSLHGGGVAVMLICFLLSLSQNDGLRSEDRPAAPAQTNSASPKTPALASADREAMRQALGKFNGLIGGWRGVGQPVRNSNRGAWSETADWLWEVKPESLALLYQVQGGKQLQSARLTYDPATRNYSLEAVLADKKVRRYNGKLDGNRLLLESEADPQGLIHQVTITQPGEKRLVTLFQNHPSGSGTATRVAEVGYTRRGTRLAVEGSSGPECIVTGGKGTMTHVYKGKTYYFCCTGCRDAFLADPEGIIAEAARRASEKKSSP